MAMYDGTTYFDRDIGSTREY